MRESLPELRMASYLAFEALPEEVRGGLVPVRVDVIEPLVPLSYPLEVCGSLIPEPWMIGPWDHLSTSYRAALEDAGVEKIVGALSAISERHGGKGLCLLDHDSPARGDRTPRLVFAEWWERETDERVGELLADGTALHYLDLPERTRPVRPKVWEKDQRWRDDAALGLSWPLSEGDLGRWIRTRHWQQARSQSNPHAYTTVNWGDARTFRLVVQHMREHGEQEVWGGELFTYYVHDGMKYWTMGAPLPRTIILNRKVFGADPQDREKGAWGAAPAGAIETPLFDRDGRPLSLAERINAEHRACALAAGAALRHAIRCGGLLREAKAGVGHGGWLPWLAQHFEGAPRTAQHYMRMSREAEAKTTLRGPNTQAVTHLAEARKETA